MHKIEKHIFEPEYAISRNLIELSRKELCELVAEICRQVKAESGNKAYHGGIYPENISRNPDGVIAIGDSKKNDWNSPELPFIAPEIYWNNKPGPQSDVYALGLILYLGASAGKFPFESESSNSQLMRMSGKTVYVPAAAGRQLGDIIEKCLRFKETERYHTPEELAVMLDYCEDNRLISKHGSGAEVIFRKSEEELSDMEKMMLHIIEDGPDAELPEEAPVDPVDEILASVRENTEETELTEDELFANAGLKRPEPQPRMEEKEDLSVIFGLDEPDPRDPAELEAEEEIRVYEPGKKKGIPILTEEEDPELAPITVKNKNNVRPQRKAARSVQKPDDGQNEQKKRPLLVVFLLLAVLLIAAVVANILINAFSENGRGNGAQNVSVVVPSSDPNTPAETMDFSSILSEQEMQAQQQAAEQAPEQEAQPAVPEVDPATLPHTYEAVRADVGWLEAQQEAIAKGGYLVTINTSEELETVVRLADQAGFDRIWIGAHRQDGNLVWESGEDVAFYRWDTNEPSYTDSGDGAAEDYVMLWYRNGQWVYNDSRENPLTDFYGMYGGRIGYIVEKVG